MRIKAVLGLFAALFTLTLHTSAQIYDPVKWKFSLTQETPGEATVVATATIEDKWHIYALKVSDDPNAIGPQPTSLRLTPGAGFKLNGPVTEGKFITHFDPNFEMDLNYFEKTARFTQKIKLTGDQPFTLNGTLEYMACNDERCIFPEPVSFELKVNPAGPEKSATEETSGAAEGASVTGEEPSASGMKEPVKWAVRSEKAADGTYDIVFTATIENGWHLYAQELKAEGPVSTLFSFVLPAQLSLEGKTSQGKPVVQYDPNFMAELEFFEGTAEFRQKIRSADGSAPTVKSSVQFMACNDEMCVPDRTLNWNVDLSTGVATPAGEDGEVLPASNQAPTKFSYLIDSIDLENPVVSDCGEFTAQPEKASSLWQLFLLGFLGGLLALLTPCVFPMVPLTVSFFTKGSKSRREGLIRAGTYGFFIFMIYILLSLPFHIFDQIDENILNNLSTNVPLNIFFFAIFVFFAFSFFGYYEITLPSGLANKMDSKSNVGGLLGSFFMALTLAIVSFSCTGPILGSLLAGSLAKDGGAIQLTVGMGGFGLALGIPFTIFAAFPGMLKSLPKSGGWLNSVKVVLGFLELALALKFFSQADMVAHWNVLKYELFIGLWILIFLLTALYIFGKLRFPHDSPLKKLSFFRLSFGILIVAWVVYLASGFRYDERYNTYKSLTLLSGLAPPVGYSWVYPKDCPHNLDCEHDYMLALERARKENKPMLIDFTGYACVNCRKMEEHVWIEPDVLKILSEDFIVVSLYVDDRKELPAELVETFTSSLTGKTKQIKTYGDRWAAFEIETFQTNSQPWYCLVSPDERLLNKPVGYTPNKDEYLQWLICGRDAFQSLQTTAAGN